MKTMKTLNISLSGLHMNWFPSSVKNFKTTYKKISSACFGESFRDKGDIIYNHDRIDENSDSVEPVSTATDMMELWIHYVISVSNSKWNVKPAHVFHIPRCFGNKAKHENHKDIIEIYCRTQRYFFVFD